MNNNSRIRLFMLICLIGLCCRGCEKSDSADRRSPAPPKAASSRIGHTSPITPPASAKSLLALTGLQMKVPKGWKAEPVKSGPMSPKAVYRLPKGEGDSEEGVVRITYFPGMKGKDELNIDRWLGQVTQSDGSSISRDEANVSITEKNQVRLTIVDVVGTVRITMRSTAKPDSRMIAAIVDHPQGPHFVVAAGGISTMEKWSSDIYQFLQSASVQE